MKSTLTCVLTAATAAMLLSSCGGEVTNQRFETSGRQSTPKLTVATVHVPAAGTAAAPTAGDIVEGLPTKASCYQPSTNTCILMQTQDSDTASMEQICQKDDSAAQVSQGNGCAALAITAKCNIQIKGDRFTIYHIGGLSQDMEKTLSDQCAGMTVDGKIYKGTYVTVTDTYTQSLRGNRGNRGNRGALGQNILDILKRVFQGIFGLLAQFGNN